MKLAAFSHSLLTAVCLALIAGCREHPAAEPNIVSLDARTLAIHEAALAATIIHLKPGTPFCLAAEIDHKARKITAYPKETEERVLAAAKLLPERLLRTADILVPKDWEMEASPSEGRRNEGLTSRSTRAHVNAYMIDKVIERSETSVKVHWIEFCSPLSARGGSMLLEFKEGAWHASRVSNDWIS